MSSGRWPLGAAAYRGLARTLAQGRPLARALAVADSRALVRSLFLASAVSSGLLPYLAHGRTETEIGRQVGSQRPDRLQAWLSVGTDLGELSRRGDRYRVAGRRARALSRGDELLAAHYRSMLEYQVGPYAELAALLRQAPGGGRPDLGRYADDIAAVSLAAAPFVTAVVRRTVAELRPARVLDVGCGSGVYTRAVLEADQAVEVDGVDMAAAVLEAARRRLAGAGFGPRLRFHTADIRDWLGASAARFDLVLLLNNIYYFDRGQRTELYRRLAPALNPGGQLLVVSMTAPGSVAASHLHFMLTCQAGPACLPGRADLAQDLVAAGYEIVAQTRLVPTEPFLAVRARLGA